MCTYIQQHKNYLKWLKPSLGKFIMTCPLIIYLDPANMEWAALFSPTQQPDTNSIQFWRRNHVVHVLQSVFLASWLIFSCSSFRTNPCCYVVFVQHMCHRIVAMLMATYPNLPSVASPCLTRCLPLSSDSTSLAVCWTPGGKASEVIIEGIAMSAHNHH